MAQQNLILGTPGDNNTGEFVYDAFAKVEANFTDLYTNYLPRLGGSVDGNLSFSVGANISNIETVAFWNQTAQNNIMSADMPSDNIFSLDPTGGTNDLNYNFTDDKWYVNTSEVLVAGTAAASQVSFTSYLTLTSATIQLVIEELKDELDAAVLAAGSGDMLKSVYDTGNNGIVDNSEALNGQTSAWHLDRTNHTGTQLASTISDFDTEVSNNTDVTANTAKVTNATHTGDVTGATALTIDPTAISGKTLVTAASGDMVLVWDATDSQLKRVNASDFLSGVVDATIQDGSVNPVQNNAVRDALVNINAWVATNNIQANKIIDGTGSGLDADLLDGVEGANFVRSDVADTVSGVLTFNAIPAFNGGTSGSTAPFTVDSTQVVTNLNADTVDGLNASQFLRSDASDSTTGELTAGSFKTGNWVIDVDGSNRLTFTYNGDLVFRIGTTGTIEAQGDGKFFQSI